ncbi:DUF3084 domain-containing protein [Deinococcus sp. KSM4-11]|uniref:DUF3084 domain-containing protein n=1 Tax=Deinococcus sp. KSM4-11 TaxID=2568654 RepID=UPI0010A56FDB|nr:DUF3084 domain-containing protein [Deinococcus sp. KSM4-11]THF84861.1 DUF3084 domain-containing protein [Deinococcus sp. KSM4-11]
MLWVFLAFVVLLSGVVAYAADTIARKAGRKHIRLFGLRPKTTALVVAVLSGMAISAASLTAFLLLNKNAVDIIAAADQLRPQLESLRQEYKTAQSDLQAANTERDAAQTEARRLGQLQDAAQRDLRATRTDLDVARQAEQRLKTETAALQGRVKTLGTTITSLESLAKDNRAKLQTSEAALKASKERAQALDAQVLDFRARTALAQQEAQNAQDRATQVQASADQAQQRAAKAEADAKAAQARAVQAQTRSTLAQATAQQAVVTAQAAARQSIAQAQATAQQAVAQAQASAKAALIQAQGQVATAQAQAAALGSQVGQLQASRQAAQRDLQTARTALVAAQAARTQADKQRQAAQVARDQITTQRDQAQGDLLALQQQQIQLKNSNDGLARDLATARATLGKLQDEYSSSRAELNASRNTDLAYPKNELVYAAVVPSVRNLDGFLKDADKVAQNRGAKGTPAVRLASSARAALETKLRGLNASTFVQCRAAQNTALGFPVDLSCDAKANSVLFHGGDIIRRVSVNLKADPRVIQDQINELVKDTVVDITTRGVPGEYIMNQGLDVTEFIQLLTRLNARNDTTAVVGMAARDDVKPSTRVDLYPILP